MLMYRSVYTVCVCMVVKKKMIRMQMYFLLFGFLFFFPFFLRHDRNNLINFGRLLPNKYPRNLNVRRAIHFCLLGFQTSFHKQFLALIIVLSYFRFSYGEGKKHC